MAKLPEKVEPYYGDFRFYEDIDERREHFWQNDVRGRIAGRLEGVFDDILLLEDTHQIKWNVLYSEESLCEDMVLHIGQRVRIIGTMSTDEVFTANIILPWDREEERIYKCAHREKKPEIRQRERVR